MKNKLTKLEFKWICYDMGNSAFILLVATILPIYFNYLSSSQGVAEHNYLSYWSYAASLSTLIVALAGPILGTLADYKDHNLLNLCNARCISISLFLDSKFLVCISSPIYCCQSCLFFIFDCI